jgi:formiminotetrahydrofolate cyclodeaminase
METARSGCELLGNTLIELATNCNANAITDLGAAAELAHSAISIAALNVRINIDSVGHNITSETDFLLASMNRMIDDIESQGAKLTDEIREIVSRRM